MALPLLEQDGTDGGYDEGYRACSCFWGEAPGSLVKAVLDEPERVKAKQVLDLGCGEGKNARALAVAGADVTAVDCSALALRNAEAELSHRNVNWVLADVRDYLQGLDPEQCFDFVIMYGLLHCLGSLEQIEQVVASALEHTKIGGSHVLVVFNDGPHDLTPHPGLIPVLAPHSFYRALYASQDILIEHEEVIHERHPHNGILHFHSISRLVVRRTL